jgi:glycosyltransferase 2 family protein
MIKKERLALVAKMLVSGGLIWLVFQEVDLNAAKERLLMISPEMLLLAGLVFLFQLAISSLRWSVVMDAISAPLPFLRVLWIYYVATFFNQTLPSSVGGDAYRIYQSHRSGLTLGGAVNGVVLERAAAVLALGLVVLASQPFFLLRVEEEVRSWVLPTAIAFNIISFSGLGVVMFFDRLPASLRKWRLVRGLVGLGSDARKVFLNLACVVRSVGWAVCGHLFLILGVYILALGIGLDVGLIDCVALVPPVLLITTLPVSIGGWGVREGAMVGAFALIGVPAEGALALSVLFGLTTAAISLPGGAVWLYRGGRQQKVAAD